MRLLLLTILSLMAGTFRPAAAQDEGLPADRYLTSVRFRVLFGGIIMGKTCIDSFQDSLNFIFDTGCGIVSLDSITAEHFNFIPRNTPAFFHAVPRLFPPLFVHNLS